MNDYRIWLRRCQRRIELARFLERFSSWLALFLVLWTAAMLWCKLGAVEWLGIVRWSGFAVIPLAMLCFFRCWRTRFTIDQVAALLDQSMQADGLLLTMSDQADGRWERQLPNELYQWREAMPRVVPVRFAKSQVLPVMFLMCVLVIPARSTTAHPVVENSVSQRTTDELTQMLTTMRDKGVIEPQEATELLTQLNQLSEQTSQGPLTHADWEALDAIRERLNLRVDTNVMNNQQALEAVTTLSQQLQGNPAQLATELTPERIEHLESVISNALQHVDPETLQAADLPPGMLPILESLRNEQGFALPDDPLAQLQLLANLQGFLSSEGHQLQDMQRIGQATENLIGQQISSGFSNLFPSDNVENGGAGAVGVGSNRPASPFGTEKGSVASKFRSVVLPPGALRDPGVQIAEGPAAAPQVVSDAEVIRSETREMNSTSGRETWSRTLRPRHRRAVRSYFSAADQPPPASTETADPSVEPSLSPLESPTGQSPSDES